MPLLRRLAPVLALLLAVLVGGQAVDALPCADETGTEACADRGAAALDADCYCHLTFAPTTAPVPQLTRSMARVALPDAAPVALCDGVAPPLVRPPIG